MLPNELREQILKRDDYKCQNCFRHAEQIHHIIPRDKHGLSVANNLISLCVKCHRLLEFRPRVPGFMFGSTTVGVSKRLVRYLNKLGKKTETYEDIIWKLINRK